MKQTDDHHVAALDRLADQLRVVMRLGEMLLSAGASAFRVKDGMDRIAHAVGIDKISIQVTYTEITATAFAGGTFRTELVEQRVMGINAERIDDLNDFVHNLPGKMLVEDADDMLDAFANKDPLYSMPVSALASGVACAGFAFLNQGGWVECLVVFFAALAGQATRKTLLRRHMNHFAVWMSCGFVATSLYMGIVSVFQIADIVDASHQSGVVSSVLFLVPGFPLVTSILDLIRQDYIAGIARGVYVVMLLISTAASVWAVTGLLNWNVNPSADGYHLNTWLLLLGRILASFVAAYGFAMLFNAPQRASFIAAVIGTVINVLRLTAQDAGLGRMSAIGLAAFLAGLLAALGAKWTKYSRVTLSVPAVVVMIPGVPLYRALSALNDGLQVNAAIPEIVTLCLAITAIGVGLALSRMVTDRNWLMS